MKCLFIVLFVGMLFCASISAQTTAFTYQGSLKDGAAPANGNYDLEFALFDAVSAGTQLGSTLSRSNVAVANGIFNVSLDFGNQFTGADRYLEIRVRLSGQPGITILGPRQLMNSAPYSIRSLNSTTADIATNATQLGGVAANQYVVTTDPRMTDARPPTSGSADYIQNGTTQQAASNFNVSGTGTANILSAATQFNIGANRILGNAGTNNLFAGIGAGFANTTGDNNSFFGAFAGISMTTGKFNSYFGTHAGLNDVTGAQNSFFGYDAGASNQSGLGNVFVGYQTGTGNMTGNSNVFLGRLAGGTNTTGGANTLVGANTNVGSNNLNFATAVGAQATVSASNTIALGRSNGSDTVLIPGGLTVNGTGTADIQNAATQYNINGSRVLSNAGTNNLFVGVGAGTANSGSSNAFFGQGAGQANTTGSNNAFFGHAAGDTNTAGSFNAFFGRNAGTSNMTGNSNSFFGMNAGQSNTTGSSNAFFGLSAGISNISGSENTLIGVGADVDVSNLTNATAIGRQALVSQSNSLVLGSIQGFNGAISNTNVGIGTPSPSSMLDVAGMIEVGTLGAAGSTTLCRNVSNQISTCSSSLRYKTNIGRFSQGMSFVNQLSPISFDWKDGGMKDVGFGAEDVAKIDPRFVTYNDKGEAEGVKYDRLSVAFVNAIKEQQEQIEDQKEIILRQQSQIDALTKLICATNKTAELCKEK